MVLVGLILAGVLFTALTALVFTGLTIFLGKLSPDFEMEGVETWDRATCLAVLGKYTIVAGVFVFISIPAGPILGLAAFAVTYKLVFGAGLKQSLVVGLAGGFIATLLFLALLYGVLIPLALLGEGAN